VQFVENPHLQEGGSCPVDQFFLPPSAIACWPLPATPDELIRHYTFTDNDLALICQCRGSSNRLGFAVQMNLLRYPGQGLGMDGVVAAPVLHWSRAPVAHGPGVLAEVRRTSGDPARASDRTSRLSRLGAVRPAPLPPGRPRADRVGAANRQGRWLAGSALDVLRRRHVIAPALEVIERICPEAVTRANRRIYRALTKPLSDAHLKRLDAPIKRKDASRATWLAWASRRPSRIHATRWSTSSFSVQRSARWDPSCRC